MAYVILRAEIPDDEETVVAYGISQVADSLIDDAWNYTGWTLVEVVEVSGPDEPRECMNCGCDAHGDADCPDCTHVLCHVAADNAAAQA